MSAETRKALTQIIIIIQLKDIQKNQQLFNEKLVINILICKHHLLKKTWSQFQINPKKLKQNLRKIENW